MPVTNYHTVNGRILGETTAGVRTDYLTDALGSVTATVNASGAVVNRYRYKPYGALLSKTGVGADPKQQWVGSLGYRQTGKKYSDMYVRARHYDTANGRWATKDPIGFAGGGWNLFGYSAQAPAAKLDPSGLYCPPKPSCGPDVTDALEVTLNRLRQAFNKWSPEKKATQCITLWPYASYPPVTASWDILDLRPYRIDKWPTCGNPRDKCGKGVLVAGRCVEDFVANYALYGVLTRLCGFDWARVLAWVALYKWRYQDGSYIGPSQAYAHAGWLAAADPGYHWSWPQSYSIEGCNEPCKNVDGTPARDWSAQPSWRVQWGDLNFRP